MTNALATSAVVISRSILRERIRALDVERVELVRQYRHLGEAYEALSGAKPPDDDVESAETVRPPKMDTR